MTVSFKQARRFVEDEMGVKTIAIGYADDDDFNVIIDPPLDDEVVLVSRDDGFVHTEVFFEVQPRLEKMAQIKDI